MHNFTQWGMNLIPQLQNCNKSCTVPQSQKLNNELKNFRKKHMVPQGMAIAFMKNMTTFLYGCIDSKVNVRTCPLYPFYLKLSSLYNVGRCHVFLK